MLTIQRRTGIPSLLVIGVVLSCLNSGCSRGKEGSADTPPALSVPGKSEEYDGKEPAASKNNEPPRHNQSFKEATISDPPDDQWLPEITKTKKSVGKLYESVVAQWDNAPFVSTEGKKLAYTAAITTNLGEIVIELWPDVAPNHVRNFIALARVGYYDGLSFDRAIKRDDSNGKFFECLEGGCPVGTGEPTHGSIGYWLKPEFNPAVTHEPGTIGAWHGAEVESAACKFYINLTKAEWMDGQFTLFGKVTKGLDVLRAIHGRPVIEEGMRDRPVEPVVMSTVVISSTVNE